MHEAGAPAPLSRSSFKPEYFPNTYFLGGNPGAQWPGTGLVQQTVQIVASHDLTLFVGRSRYAEEAVATFWIQNITSPLLRGIVP